MKETIYHLDRAAHLISHAQDALYLAIGQLDPKDARQIEPLIRAILQHVEPYTDGPQPYSIQTLIRNLETM